MRQPFWNGQLHNTLAEPTSNPDAPSFSCRGRFRCFYLLTVLAPVFSIAGELPSGTTLSVRAHVSVGTRFSKVGDPVSGVLLSPVLQQGHDSAGR